MSSIRTLVIDRLRSRLPREGDSRGMIYSNAVWLIADKVLRLAVGVMVISLVTRYLGPELFGLWNFALAVVAICTSVAGMGLDTIVVREIVRKPSESGEILGSAAAIKAISGLFAFGMALGLSAILRPGDKSLAMLVFAAALGLFANPFDVIDFFFQAKTRSKYVVYSRNAAFLLFSLVKIGFVFFSAPLIAFAAVGSAEAAAAALFMFIAYWKHAAAPRALRARLATMSALLQDSWPMLLSGLAIMLYMRIDQIMLASLSTEEEVGIYSAAVRLSEMWYFIPTAIVTSAFPSIVKLREDNPAKLDATMQKYYDIMALIGISASTVVYFTSSFMVETLFGARFSASALVLTIHIWCGVFVCLGMASSMWLTAENLQRINFIRTCLGCLTNIIINFYAIPRYGAIGASVATLISYSMATFSLVVSKETKNQGVMMFKSFLLPRHLRRLF